MTPLVSHQHRPLWEFCSPVNLLAFFIRERASFFQQMAYPHTHFFQCLKHVKHGPLKSVVPTLSIWLSAVQVRILQWLVSLRLSSSKNPIYLKFKCYARQKSRFKTIKGWNFCLTNSSSKLKIWFCSPEPYGRP